MLTGEEKEAKCTLSDNRPTPILYMSYMHTCAGHAGFDEPGSYWCCLEAVSYNDQTRVPEGDIQSICLIGFGCIQKDTHGPSGEVAFVSGGSASPSVADGYLLHVAYSTRKQRA